MPYGKNVIVDNSSFVLNDAGAFVIVDELPTTKVHINVFLEEYLIQDMEVYGQQV